MTAQSAARPNVHAGEVFTRQAGQTKESGSHPAVKNDLSVQTKADKAAIKARIEQSQDVSKLDIAYSKQEATLSVKVTEAKTQQLIREINFRDFKAMSYSNHGYKGAYVDLTA